MVQEWLENNYLGVALLAYFFDGRGRGLGENPHLACYLRNNISHMVNNIYQIHTGTEKAMLRRQKFMASWGSMIT